MSVAFSFTMYPCTEYDTVGITSYYPTPISIRDFSERARSIEHVA